MAPSTRLQADSTRRILYSTPTLRVGSRSNPIDLDHTAQPEPVTAPKKRVARKQSGKRPSRTVPRIRAGAVVKPKELPEKTKTVTEPKQNAPRAKRDCSICVSSKGVATCFRLDRYEQVCEHFESTCSQCVQKMVNGLIAKRQLAEAELACPVSGCEHVLDYTALKTAFTNKTLFADYDKALARHHLAASPSFVACLSPKCGRYFSIEDCTVTTKRATKQKIDCPYCDYELCLTCNRPWHSKSGCSKAKEKEDLDSLKQIKTMGAKPCPKCGINIEKSGGCNHMTCRHCRHDFCWQCLILYNGNVPHLAGCPDGRHEAAINPFDTP